MHEAQQPVLLLSGDMHWAGVFNAGGVLEVSASPIAQVSLCLCVSERMQLEPGARTGHGVACVRARRNVDASMRHALAYDTRTCRLLTVQPVLHVHS